MDVAHARVHMYTLTHTPVHVQGSGGGHAGASKQAGVEAMIKAAQSNKQVKARLDAAAQQIERAARGHMGRNKVKRIQAKQSKKRLK